MLTPCGTRLRTSFWGSSCASQAHSAHPQSRRYVRISASLSGKGKRFPAELITVKKIMGEGSYGQVFEGALNSEQGPARVVLKRVKKRVQGAEEMGQMEHLLNVYASKAAKGSIADFVGYVEVDDEEATAKLTQGVWLMWRYQGSKTLSYYLRRRDCIAALAEDLGVQQEAVVPTVFKQVLDSVAALHAAGLVHRDVKPMNIIFAEDDRSFKLIDLGACADLRSGTNYVPDESILDPTYCPPEQYCMPTDAPHLAKHGAFAMAMSPLLWQRFKPDKFDSYSAGLCLMQLAVPKLRSASGLQRFNSAFKAAGYDLGAWRDRANLSAKETAILDAEDAAGWELAEALLRPRSIDINEDSGSVRFVNTNGQAARLGVSLALNHRFIKLAQATSPAASAFVLGRTHSLGRTSGRNLSAGCSEQTLEQNAAAALAATSPTPSKGGLFSMAMGVWKKATSKLFDLEAKIANQTDAVSTQTARVQQLKDQAATGKVSVAKVKQEESVLTKMKGRLTSLTSEFNATAQSANRLVGSLMNKSKGTGIEADSIPLLDPIPQAGASSHSPRSSRASLRRSDLPPSLQKSHRTHRQVATAADAVLDSAQLGNEGAATSPRAAARSSASDRQQIAQPKVVRKNLTRITSSSGKFSSSSSKLSSSLQPDASSTNTSNPGVNMLYAGLKFTGLALNVAGDLAKAVRQDAEKMMKDIEADASAKKLAKEQAAAFVDLLRDTQPGVTSVTSLSDVESTTRDDERWLVMSANRRQQIFGTYTDALRKIEDAARQRAASGFKAMLVQSNISITDDWSSVQAQLASSSAFSAVESELDRQAMFQDHIAELQEVANQAAAAARQEEEFWGLLETQDPPLTRHSSWLGLRRQIYSDPRYTALPERRCRQLFNQYHSTLRDLQSSVPAPTPALLSRRGSIHAQSISQASPPQSAIDTATAGQADLASVTQLEQEVSAVEEAMASASMPSAADQLPVTVDSSHTEDALELLRQEQAQLKREYDRMQAKLLEMEALLRKKETGTGPGTITGSESPARSLSVSANGSSAASPTSS